MKQNTEVIQHGVRWAGATLATLLWVVPVAHADDLAVWRADGLTISDKGWKLKDSKGDFDLTSPDAQGVKLGDGPERVGGKGALYFDGSQNSPAKATTPLPALSKVKLVLKVRPEGGDGLQTIIKAGRVFELRYDAQRARFDWITWSGDNAYTSVVIKAEVGEWNFVVAEIGEGKINLKVGDAEAKKPIEGPCLEIRESAKVYLGSNGDRATLENCRAFTGAIAEISLSGELQ